jgi:hypothetical protein
MNFRCSLFLAIIALAYATPSHAFKVVIVNNTKEDVLVTFRLQNTDTHPEHSLGTLKAFGGIGEKQFEDPKATVCIDYIKVGDLKPEIFEVSKDQYDNFMAKKDNPRDVTAYFDENRKKLRPLSPKGACLERRFDIIGNIINIMDTHPIIITKAIY